MHDNHCEGDKMNTEELVEMNDLDQDIDQRRALIAKAKELSESEEVVDFREVEQLQKAYRRIPNQESLYEQQLNDEFDAYLSKFHQARNEMENAAKQAKEAVVAKAKELAKDTKNWSAMNALMDEWKACGRCAKADDEALWNEFSAIRKEFYDNRKKAYEAIKANYENAKATKESLIEKAKELVDNEDIVKTNQLMNDLMEQWKAAGRAAKEDDDALWEAFNQARQVFYDRRKVYFDDLKAQYAVAVEKKQALIATAKEYVVHPDYSKETVNTVKNLVNEWKEAGFAGRNHDEKLWKEFRETLDQYFDGLKEFNEYRREQFKTRMEQSIANKENFIQTQRRNLQRMQAQTSEMISESSLADLEDAIAQKEAFIAQLEEELDAMRQRLEK